MKSKSPAPEELRMRATDFDRMMRGALSAPPPRKAKPKQSGKRKSAVRK